MAGPVRASSRSTKCGPCVGVHKIFPGVAVAVQADQGTVKVVPRRFGHFKGAVASSHPRALDIQWQCLQVEQGLFRCVTEGHGIERWAVRKRPRCPHVMQPRHQAADPLQNLPVV